MGGGFVRPVIAALLLGTSSTTIASDTLKFGPPPSWVIPAKIPASTKAASDAPAAILLNDQHILFEPGKRTTFSEIAVKIQTAQGLSAGNVAIPWDPATQEVTVHKLHVLRGDQLIDVLANQKFTTIRREANLEAAVLDGRLTAMIQPEGLQEGDIVRFALTVEHADPAMKGHVEAAFATWNAAPITLGQARLIWPRDMKLKIRQSEGLPAPKTSTEDGRNVAYLSLQDIEPIIAPSGAPPRFQLGRIAEASDFASWSEVAETMIPHYRKAAHVPASGPLRDEVERIRKEATTPKARAEMALALVQDRVRYVALLMGEGGVVPASAESSWAQRLGDCKAKTALLIAMLGELGIEAVPVLVHTSLGDAIPERLPMLGLFNHVVVRAKIDGKTYWLDGTRTGDARLDKIQVPSFRWGLPITPNAGLVPIAPAPLEVPGEEQLIEIDATAGAYAQAPVRIQHVVRGDTAVGLNALYAQVTTAQREEIFRSIAKELFNGIKVTKSSVQFDKAAGELRQTIEGEARLDWKNGWYHVPSASLAFEPDFERAAGAIKDAPFAIDFPGYEVRRVTIRLPAGFATGQARVPTTDRETLAGVEYERRVKIEGDVLTVETSERSVTAEVPYKDAIAAAPRLKSLNDADIHLRIPPNYRRTVGDAVAFLESKPGSAADYLRRGQVHLDQRRWDEAIADMTEVLKAEPGNAEALANRAMSYVWKKNYAAAEKDIAALPAGDQAKAFEQQARGLMAELKQDLEGAIAAYTRANEMEPRQAFALGRRAFVYRAHGEVDKALADAERALELAPAWMDLRMLRANILVGKGKRDEAAREARLLIEQNPQSGYAHVAAANILSRVGRKDEAMQGFEKALAIKPEAFIYLNRALARPLSDKAGRLADLDAALKIDPDDAYVLIEKANQLAESGQLDEALKLYDRAKPSADAEFSLMVARSVVLHRLGKTAEAEKAFAELRTRATSADELNNLCWDKAIKAIMLESALAECRESLKQQPENGATLDSLGMVLLKLGRLDEALEAYSRAVAKDTGAESLMGRAMVYARKGDSARAAADRDAALKLDPDAETRFAEYGLTF